MHIKVVSHPAHPAACDPVHPVNILKINRMSRIASGRMRRIRNTYMEMDQARKVLAIWQPLGLLTDTQAPRFARTF